MLAEHIVELTITKMTILTTQEIFVILYDSLLARSLIELGDTLSFSVVHYRLKSKVSFFFFF